MSKPILPRKRPYHATRSTQRAIRGHSDGVQGLHMTKVVGLQLAVGQVPHLQSHCTKPFQLPSLTILHLYSFLRTDSDRQRQKMRCGDKEKVCMQGDEREIERWEKQARQIAREIKLWQPGLFASTRNSTKQKQSIFKITYGIHCACFVEKTTAKYSVSAHAPLQSNFSLRQRKDIYLVLTLCKYPNLYLAIAHLIYKDSCRQSVHKL